MGQTACERLAVLAAAVPLSIGAAGKCCAEVRISGYFKAGFDSTTIDFTSKNPRSEQRVVDEGSRITFRAFEDLSTDLRAFARYDLIVRTDSGVLEPSGNQLVGLSSKRWGRLMLGSAYRHFYHRESDMFNKAVSGKVENMSLLSYARGGVVPTAGALPIANHVATPNVVSYETPKWEGFTLDISYSSNPFGPDADISSGTRRGRGWNLNPNLSSGNLRVGYSYWDAKGDGGFAADQRADRYYGSYKMGGLKLGLVFDRSILRFPVTGILRGDRWAWSFPIQYQAGRHNFFAHYSRAEDDRASPGVPDGARMIALAYAYDLSNMTSVGMSLARIRNDSGAAYNFFGTTGAAGSASAAVAAGESPRIWAVTIRHEF